MKNNIFNFIYMNKIYFFITLIILIIILLILLNKFSKGTYKIEFFEQKGKCPSFFKNSFCQFDKDKNICNCRYQKDDVRYTFQSPETCCNNICRKLNKENCLYNKGYSEIPYYCNIGGDCKKYYGTIISGQISANNCGTDPLNNQILLPYTTKEECLKASDPCNKYNKQERSMNKNKEECLKDTNCGFCTNSTNGGKCISGTISGPLDLQKYYYCNPAEAKFSNNKYYYGNNASYILQEPDGSIDLDVFQKDL
jgi:hypothetical protein